jgi:hypothetical protein
MFGGMNGNPFTANESATSPDANSDGTVDAKFE